MADAQAAIARLNVEGPSLVKTEALARILLRAEAVASSRIEGLDIGARRLLHAEVARGLDEPSSNATATEVLGNIHAMVYGIESVHAGDEITADLILEVHRRLLAGTLLEEYGGRFREVQNWIGGSSYNPCSAARLDRGGLRSARALAQVADIENGMSHGPMHSGDARSSVPFWPARGVPEGPRFFGLD